MATAPAIEVVDVDLDDLSPHPRNYRQHPDEQLDEIGRSIEAHGYYRNVVVARDGTILAGHGVVAAARRLGRTSVPAYRLDVDPFDPRALKLLVGDNELSNLAVVDDRALTEMLRTIMAEAEDGLTGTGFDEERLAALLYVTRPASEIADYDAAAEWVGLPDYDVVPPETALVVLFDAAADRERFVAEFDLHVESRRGGRWSLRWPERPRQDLSAVRWE